jgi:hypothetical protein
MARPTSPLVANPLVATISCFASLALAFTLPCKAQQVNHEAPAKPTTVELTQRKEPAPTEKEAYAGSAYSFRLATSNDETHRNYADLVLNNNCGLLHLNPVDDMASRLAPLGPGDLNTSPDTAPNPAWIASSFKPAPGENYRLEIAEGTERMTVKIHIDQVTPTTVKFTWKTLEPLTGTLDRSNWGKAGMMGKCATHTPGTDSAGAGGRGGKP